LYSERAGEFRLGATAEWVERDAMDKEAAGALKIVISISNQFKNME
jgi:hypothetical protein